MEGGAPHIEVRAVEISDAPALHALDYSFETERIYTLRVQNRLLLGDDNAPVADKPDKPAFAFELIETAIEPSLYKDYREYGSSLQDTEGRLGNVDGGYIALADGQVAGAILLKVKAWRRVARIEDIIVGRQFRRYGVGSLLLKCASDWARNRGCWAIVLETQNINYPAIQFYLRNGLEIWSINQHFYPPGAVEHEVAIFMGKKLK